MSVFAWIMVGLIAGWLAAKVTNAPQGLLRNLAVGLVGAILGGFMFDRLGIQLVPGFFGGLITSGRLSADLGRRSGGPKGGCRLAVRPCNP